MHQKSVEDVYKTLKTRASGLTNPEAAERLKTYGPNIIQKKKKKSWIVSLLEEFTDLMVMILIFAAIIAIASGETKDGGVILFIVVLNAMIGFIQKFKAEKALEALQKMLSPHAKVMRNGKIEEIEASKIVPGDIVLLAEGDKVPADARLLEENEIEVDESPLTGESVPVAKQIEAIEKKEAQIHEHLNIVFMGTSVTHGTGKAIVIRTGMDTEFGKIANLTQTTDKDKSPLQKELFKIGVFVGKITFVISSILLITGWLIQGKEFTETFLFATSVAVAAVPEGLPATVTIALAIGVQRLARKRSIVKKLASVETLGSTTVICSDKTGTLTKNEMTVVKVFSDNQTISVEGKGYNPTGKWSMDAKRMNRMETLCTTAILCNNSKLHKKNAHWGIIGDPTEGALLVAAQKTLFTIEKTLKQYKRLHELPFDSVRKMMTTIDQHKTSKKIHAHLKGAPDEVLKICSHSYENGKIVKLTPQKRRAILKENEAMAKQALRVLAFATREIDGKGIPRGKKQYSKALVEKGMIFVGLMGMIDPARPEVYNAVELAKKAGIKIYMVTGDYGVTAEAIARELKIVEGTEVRVISGAELAHINEAQLSRLLKNKKSQIIFARVSPEHKLKIVRALKKNGEIVAMTGDGVNDAPALKRADIGVAMGITGTDVSKEAADMVLVDDSFGTIVTAVEEGRTIYTNLKKFVFYVFSCNIGELVTVFTAIILNLPPPLTAILILAVDLGTDVLPALAIGVEPAEPGIMEKPPRSQKEHIMKKGFIAHFVGLGMCIGLIVVSVYFYMLEHYGWNWGESLDPDSLTYLKASTSAFVMLVFIQMVNAFNVRSATHSIFRLGFFTNKWLTRAIGISLITAVLFVEIPFFQGFLHTTGLTWDEWLVLGTASLLIFVIEEVRKSIARRIKIA